MPVDKFPPIFYFAAKALPKKDVAFGLLAREKKASAHVLSWLAGKLQVSMIRSDLLGLDVEDFDGLD